MFVTPIKYSLAILMTAGLFFNLHAGEITIRQIPIAKELPSNTAYRMFQDKEGFVWLGTPNGFCRYDGYRMKSFRSEITNPTFSSNYITGGFAEDTLNHALWIGTEKGVLILDKYTHKITLLDTALLGESPIRQILYADNAMWVSSDHGLYHYNTDKTLRKKYLNDASGIHIDNRGTVRATSRGKGIYYLEKATDTFIPYPAIGSNNNPHTIFQDNADRFWICTWGDGFYRFYPDRRGQDMYERIDMTDDKNLSRGTYYDVEQDNVNGYLWIFSYAGVSVIKPKTNSIAPVNESATKINNYTTIFSDIMKDREGNLWLGTYNQGVLLVNPALSTVTNFDLQSIKTETGYIPNVVRTIFEDKEGEIWFMQSRLGLYLFDPKRQKTQKADISNISEINAICNNPATDEIWVAADHIPCIYRLRKSKGKVYLTGTIDLRTVFADNAEIVQFLCEDRNGAVWIATNNALFSWKHGNWQLVKDDLENITCIAEDSYGAIWIGTAKNGLWQITSDGDKTNSRNYNTNTSRIAGNNISCISADANGQLWFCVNEKQLYIYDITKQEFTDYTHKANVNNLVIFNVIAGDNGHIWISSDKQVVEFNPLTGASIQYDTQNDLIVTSLNKNSIAKTGKGSVVFGGNNGLCIFTPSPKLDKSCKETKTIITDVKINGKSFYQRDLNRKNLDWQKELILLSHETNLEIDFSSFDYLNPGKTRYAYKLENVDNHWINTESGRSFAVYNQLRKGKYTFLVKSTGENQLWSDEITRLVIIKKPAFYETAWAYSGYAIILLLILFAGLQFYTGRIKLRNELRIAQIDKEKSEELIQTKLRFFTNIGHEFRTPLTLVMTPLSTLIRQLTDENLKQKLASIYRNAEEMLGLINQLLDFRKLEMGGEKLKLSCNDFVKFAEYVYSAFKDVATNKSIHFTFESEVRQLFMGFDKSKVQKIINNLYSNALKFTSEEGYIATTIRLVQENGREFVCLGVEDSGCGIPVKEQLTIFERFYQSENNDLDRTGSGIGLHLVKEYVELHGGQITLSSKVGQGSVFSVLIPTDLQISDTSPECDDAINSNTANVLQINLNQEHKRLLVVEDNLELLHFLAEQLSGKFNVLQAANGKEGAEIALKKLPDLIVSDLMMPVLNGLEMCRRLKTDIRTSHIPIILLTARLSDESKIESYKAGADSYIAKPFTFEVLLACIEMLIEQQEKRRKLFHKTVEITPSRITATSLDEELIKKALSAVEKNMDNSGYSVEELASECALSHRQLSRKFQSIIGLSPSEFIRSVRLKRAAQLLKDTQYHISEISDRVGFSTIKYFNLNFKEEFGVTPTQYRKGDMKRACKTCTKEHEHDASSI
jgi:signal transduction histidine kinase/ligand-binding sensor domain-containing protein/DNA-binding response OmpR family regulator